jgi:hypothetical protein
MPGYKSILAPCRFIEPVIFILILVASFDSPSFGQNNFIPGEDLKYIVYFGPVNAGMATINLKRVIHNNEQVYYCKLGARSIGLPDKLYRIRDTYECYFDSITVLPYMAIRDIREGRKYKKKNIDTYDHKNRSIYSINKGEIKMLNVTRDVICAFYFIRNYDFNNLKTGDIITMDLLFDDELMTFRLHYLGKETIDARIGEINCLKLVPEIVEAKKPTDSENVSPNPEDEMTIWLSDDANQVPVRVKFDLLIGSIKADLIEYINLKY